MPDVYDYWMGACEWFTMLVLWQSFCKYWWHFYCYCAFEDIIAKQKRIYFLFLVISNSFGSVAVINFGKGNLLFFGHFLMENMSVVREQVSLEKIAISNKFALWQIISLALCFYNRFLSNCNGFWKCGQLKRFERLYIF